LTLEKIDNEREVEKMDLEILLEEKKEFLKKQMSALEQKYKSEKSREYTFAQFSSSSSKETNFGPQIIEQA
jgi:hypothetical protein